MTTSVLPARVRAKAKVLAEIHSAESQAVATSADGQARFAAAQEERERERTMSPVELQSHWEAKLNRPDRAPFARAVSHIVRASALVHDWNRMTEDERAMIRRKDEEVWYGEYFAPPLAWPEEKQRRYSALLEATRSRFDIEEEYAERRARGEIPARRRA